jgi:hypothetical protein
LIETDNEEFYKIILFIIFYSRKTKLQRKIHILEEERNYIFELLFNDPKLLMLFPELLVAATVDDGLLIPAISG